MGIKETVRTWFVNLFDLDDLYNSAQKERAKRLEELSAYYDGDHKKQIKVRPFRFDDNIVINLCRLIIDKAVSSLVGDPDDGDGVYWTFPSDNGEETPKHVQWLTDVWDGNNRPILLHKNALSGALSGFPAIKTVPDGEGGIQLKNIDPNILTVETDPQDVEKIVAYTITYVVLENDKHVRYREVTKQNGESWVVETQRMRGTDRWEAVGPPVLWAYPFPPILTWQNLPAIGTPYGRSDIEDVIGIQDRYNFLVSNLSKIVRLYAHPFRYARGLTPQQIEDSMSSAPGEMPAYQGDGEIAQLSSEGDMPGALLFVQSLREVMFAISREIDVQSMKDKVGAITNFALRVLYRDFLDKLGTKRMLYGAAYQELNRRLLILGGLEPETCAIHWPDPLPVDDVAEINAITSDLNLGLVSKQTARDIRGYDNEQETERMQKESTASGNAGAELLKNFFNRG